MTSREAEIQARLDEWPSTPQEYITSCPEDWSDVGYDYVASRAFDQGYGYGLYKARPDVAYLLARVATLEAQVAADVCTHQNDAYLNMMRERDALRAQVAAVRELHVEQFSQWFNESGEPIESPVSVGCSCGSYRYPCRELEALNSAGGGG